MKDPTKKRWREKATELYAATSDNDIEIDANARVSRGNGGAFVQAWVYVRDSDMGLEDEEENDSGDVCPECECLKELCRCNDEKRLGRR